jgi:hypothetical protein
LLCLPRRISPLRPIPAFADDTHVPTFFFLALLFDAGVYDTVFTCRGGEVFVLRVDVRQQLQRQRSWRAFGGCGGADHVSAPIVVRLWGCRLATEHSLIDNEMHVRLAYRDDKLLVALQPPRQQHPPPPPPPVPQPQIVPHQPPPVVPQEIEQHHQPPPSSLRSVHTAPSTDTGPSSPGASFVMAPATVTPSPPVLRDPPAAYKDQAPTVMPITTNQHRPAVLVTHNTVHSAAQSSFLAPSTYDPHHYDPHHYDPQQQQDVIMVQAEPVRTRDGRMMMMMAHHDDDDDDGCGG